MYTTVMMQLMWPHVQPEEKGGGAALATHPVLPGLSALPLLCCRSQLRLFDGVHTLIERHNVKQQPSSLTLLLSSSQTMVPASKVALCLVLLAMIAGMIVCSNMADQH
jgi:hypothetical protein